MIISVGYRVNSKRVTQFRIWATKTLKEHLIKGYTINQKRLLQAHHQLQELQDAISFMQEKSKYEPLAGLRKINDNALTTLTLLIAISHPNDKDKLIKIITNLLNL